MSTVINNPTSERVIERESSSGAPWAVAVIILLVLVAVGGFLWFRTFGAPAAAPADGGGSTNINVELPDVVGGAGGAGADTAPGGAAPGGTGGAAPPTE